MSITDELRDITKDYAGYKCIMFIEKGELLTIADRIDAEYEHELTMARGESVNKTLEVIGDGYMALPKDADGVPIHIGDMMECDELPNGNRVCGEVKAISNDCVWLINVQYKIHAKYLRHHHEPTVEDVLREFAGTLASAENNWGSDVNDAIAEYAAKLQLRGDGE